MQLLSIILFIIIIIKAYSRLNSSDKRSYCNSRRIENITYINENGYRCFTDSHRLVHRWLMGKFIRRRLYPEEVVHHKDGDKLNNRRNNLRLFPNQAEHFNHHIKNQIYSGSWHERTPNTVVYK